MKPEEINKAIAEACGWTEIKYDAVIHGWMYGKRNADSEIEDVPDFHGSLDAMAGAVNSLDIDGRGRWLEELIRVTRRDTKIQTWDVALIANATAAQHAEAFLRAKNLWKENQT